MKRRPNPAVLVVALSTGAALLALSGCLSSPDAPAEYGVKWRTFDDKSQQFEGELPPGSSETFTVHIDWPNMVRLTFKPSGNSIQYANPPAGYEREYEFLITSPGDLGVKTLKKEGSPNGGVLFELNPVPEPASLSVVDPDERILVAAQQFETHRGRGDWTVKVSVPERPTTEYAAEGSVIMSPTIWGMSVMPTFYEPVADMPVTDPGDSYE